MTQTRKDKTPPLLPRIEVYYVNLGAELSSTQFSQYLSLLPETLHSRITRYMFWQDRQRSLYGKLLLRHALVELGFSGEEIGKMTYSKYDRPALPLDLDFNISHSGEWIVCAVTLSGRVGVDIEAVRDIPLTDFTRVMTPEQWAEIHAAKQPADTFFRYWAMKESVIKANGKGLSIPLHQLEIENGKVIHEGQTWVLWEYPLVPEHTFCVASNLPEYQLSFKEISVPEQNSIP